MSIVTNTINLAPFLTRLVCPPTFPTGGGCRNYYTYLFLYVRKEPKYSIPIQKRELPRVTNIKCKNKKPAALFQLLTSKVLIAPLRRIMDCIRYANRDLDWMIDCHLPWNMIKFERITREKSHSVVGWRLHHHHRKVDQEKYTAGNMNI